MARKLVVWFNEVDKEDVALVGAKGANLGEMIKAGFSVPNGFIVTSAAYYLFLRENKLESKIQSIIADTTISDTKQLNSGSKKIKNLILHGTLSLELVNEVFAAYKKLGGVMKDALVTVLSSTISKDLPNASFAGQQKTFLNVKGEANLLLYIKEVWASLFDAKAILYRNAQKYDHFKIGIAIPIQKMIESEKSGIMFTLDPVTNDKSKIVIEAILGLGEYIIQGKVTPDHYEVSKQTLGIISTHPAIQTIQLIKKGIENKEVKISQKNGSVQKLTDKEIISLADVGKRLEKHYYFPQDSEWAIENGKIFIIQSRPVTTANTKKFESKKQVPFNLLPIMSGEPASPGIVSGPVKIVMSAHDMYTVQTGDILVMSLPHADYVPAMKRVVGMVTDEGGRTSQAAIAARELGIPAIVGAQGATKELKNGMIITLNGSKGEIYKGSMQGMTHTQDQAPLLTPTATKVYVNLAEPQFAHTLAQKHVDGIGLLKAEFMMAQIGTHPKKMITDGKSKEFVEKLAVGIAEFCKVFTPRPVVYRASDFKTNEYRNFLGGRAYELEESNPLLGYRGAYRYVHDPEVFELELEAIKQVRNKYGYKNLWMMVPFVRNVKELIEVKKIISAAGLYRSPTFKIWMMVEIPANVILLDKFIAVGIDGVSIGSNDLSMLMLGTDRDNDEVRSEFDDQNDALLWAYEKVIKTCQTYKITSSICGQAPSVHLALLERLVRLGITSVSVSPDMIDTVRLHIAQIERNLIS